MSGDVEAYLQPEAPEHLVLHAVRAPTWLVGRRFGDPLRDLDRLGLVERAALPVERGFKTALEPDERVRGKTPAASAANSTGMPSRTTAMVGALPIRNAGSQAILVSFGASVSAQQLPCKGVTA